MAEKKPEKVDWQALGEALKDGVKWWNGLDPRYRNAIGALLGVKVPVPPAPQKTPAKFPESRANATRRSAFALLGLKTDATAKDIRAAHRRLLKTTHKHPDQGGEDTQFRKLEEAYKIALAWAEKHGQ